MENKKLTYSEAIAEVEQILARLRDEQIDVDALTERAFASMFTEYFKAEF